MAVVRTAEHTELALLHHLKEGLHHSVHIHVTGQVRVLEIVALGITLRASEMHEISPVPKLAHHSDKIVVSPDAERTSAEAKAVGPVRDRGDQFTEIIRR